MSQSGGHFYRFGPFRLDVAGRLLWRGDDIVPLTPKAIDALQVLVESGGRVVSKDELMSRVWPDAFVEEANLSHHIYKIREALGEQADGGKYIETLSKRGYRFIARVDTDQPAIQAPAAEPTAAAVSPGGRVARLPRATVVVGVALSVIAVAGYVLSMTGAIARPTPSTSIHSIAVLPFLPLASADHDEALELGMANAVIMRLTNASQLNVRPTSAVLQYGNPSRDPIAAGREQRVDAIVDGKIQRSGDRVRVTVQLLQVQDGRPVWAETFDQKAEGVFSIQDAISDRVVGSLRIRLSGDERAQLTKHETANLAAYDAFLRGFYHSQTFAPGGFEKAVEYLNQAVTLDPKFARAWAVLGFSYVELPFSGLSTREGVEKGRTYIARALDLDDNVFEAHAALVNLKQYYDWDWAGAERECLRLQQIAPGSAVSHQMYGWYLGLMGRFDEGLVQARAAQSLDPMSANITGVIAANRLWAHVPDEVFAEARRWLELHPGFSGGHDGLGQAYAEQGRYADAAREWEQADAPPVIKLGYLGQAYAFAGRTADAKRTLATLEHMHPGGYDPVFQMAQIQLGLGDKDRAMALLEKAYTDRSPWLSWLKVEPSFDTLRSDPRFTDLLRRIGFK